MRTLLSTRTVVFVMLSMVFSTTVQAKMSHKALNVAWQDLLNNEWLVEQDRFPYQLCFEKSALDNNISLPLLLSVARGESSFNPQAVSKANAIGIMQIQWPGTAKHLKVKNKNELFEPCANIEYGARYLRQLLTKYKENIHMTLAAYNYGPSRISIQSSHLPSGALWYSEYILNHHDHVMHSAYAAQGSYQQKQALAVVTFEQPYRAQAMMIFLQEQFSSFKFDWFATTDAENANEFMVRVLVSSPYEQVLAKRQLANIGFKL